MGHQKSLIIGACAALALSAGAAGSHPHLFVSTTLVLELDSLQRVTGVTMTWEYDEFFSLLILEEMELDADLDGALTQSELDKLMGFDLIEWPEGFEGDLYLTHADGTKIEMPRPVPHDIALTDGKIFATQKRVVPNVPAEGLQVQQYDPTYYVAYDLNGGIELPAPCAARIAAPDQSTAESEIARLIQQQTSDDIFVSQDLGHLYADKIVISCE